MSSRWEKSDDGARWSQKTRFPDEAGTAVQRHRCCDSDCAASALNYVSGGSRASWSIRFVAFSRQARTVSSRADPACCLSESRRQSMGWRHSRYPLLGSKRERATVPGVCDQLRASGLPGAVVSAIQSVHVSLSRRRLLPGWLPSFRTSGARLVSVPPQA